MRWLQLRLDLELRTGDVHEEVLGAAQLLVVAVC